MHGIKVIKYKYTQIRRLITVKKPRTSRRGLKNPRFVKGYIGKVTEDKTNILFIRKTDEIDKPFFTVEITNVLINSRISPRKIV